MSRLFSGIVFSSFLLFQTIAMAEEENASTEIAVEEMENSEEDNQTDLHSDETQEETETEDALSELEKEALAAEAAELRELGMEEEPMPE